MRLPLGSHSVEFELGPESRGARRATSPGQPAPDWLYSFDTQCAGHLGWVASYIERKDPSEKHLLVGLHAAAAEVLERYWHDGRSLSCVVHDQFGWRIPRHRLWAQAEGRVGRQLAKSNWPPPKAFERIERQAADLAVRNRQSNRPAYLMPEHLLLILAETSRISESLVASGLDLDRLRSATGGKE